MSRADRQLNSDFSGEVDVKIRKRCVIFFCTTPAKRRMGSVTSAVGPHCHIRGDGITSLMVFGVAPEVDFAFLSEQNAHPRDYRITVCLLTRTTRTGWMTLRVFPDRSVESGRDSSVVLTQERLSINFSTSALATNVLSASLG